MVQTPVGARCPSCARLSRVPTYNVSGTFYLRAAGAALGIALVCGAAWGVFRMFIPFFILNLLLAGGVGYAVSEVVGLSVNRKRGIGLAAIGALAVIFSYLISVLVIMLFFQGWRFPFLDILALGIGIFVSVTRLR